MTITAVVHRAMRFSEANTADKLYPRAEPQIIPAHIAVHPYFTAAVICGWVTDVKEHQGPGTSAPRNLATRTGRKGGK